MRCLLQGVRLQIFYCSFIISKVNVEVPWLGDATIFIALTLISIFFVAPLPPAGVIFAQMMEPTPKVVLLGAFAVGADTPVKVASLISVMVLLLNLLATAVSAEPVPSTRNIVFFRVLVVGVAGDQDVPLHLKVASVEAEMFAGLLKEIASELLVKMAKSICPKTPA